MLTQVLVAQTNLDFESWNGNEPNGWESSNSITMAVGGDQTVFKESADPSEGNFSLKLVTGNCPDCPNYAPLGPLLPLPLPDPMGGVIQLGSYISPGIPFTDRPVSVDLDYKAMPMANDFSIFYVELLKYDAVADTSEVIGEASFEIGSQVLDWTHVSIPFVYHSTETPNKLDIFAASSAGSIPDFSVLSPFPLPVLFPAPVAGSTLFIDDIQFTLPSCTGFSVSLNGVKESSPMACDGQITATANGGTPPYSYLWDEIPPITTPTISGLCPGIYKVEVLDANGCLDIQTYTVLYGTCGGFNVSMSSTNASSPTANDGSATATITGGSAPYDILWSNGTFLSSSNSVTTINNLAVGTYGIEVVDASGYCAWIDFTTVWGPGGPVSVSEIKETLMVSAFPNPSGGIFSLEVEDPIERISVYNQLGKEVYQATVNSNYLSLDLTNQPNGIYFFQITGKTGNSTGKLIKQ